MAERVYVGKAGQLAVMAEFLLRGYNVAMPEVDVGDDIFVVHDEQGRLWRIQVKTALGKAREYGHSGRFAVRLSQLRTAKTPELFYVFALRREAHWDFVIVPRRTLFTQHRIRRVGSRSGDNLVVTLRFKRAE